MNDNYDEVKMSKYCISFYYLIVYHKRINHMKGTALSWYGAIIDRVH